MDTKKQGNVTIIGSGIGGCFLAVMLARKGYHVEIYERFSKEEVCDANSKRSYNLTIYGYGIAIAKEAGIWEQIKPHLFLLEGSSTQITKESKPIFTPIDPHTQYYAVSRARIIEILLEEVEKSPLIAVNYETDLLSINRYEKTITVKDKKTNTMRTVSCDVVFGADGANSIVRPFIQQGQETKHTQEYVTWTYKQLLISKKMMQKLALNDKVVHSWTRKRAFILSIPNADGSLSALLVVPKGRFADLNSENAIKKFITDDFPFLLPATGEIAKSVLENPEGYFVTIHTEPWYYKNFMALIGDAAHGFNPFLGQGISAAFGDGMEIIKLLNKYGSDWGKIFPIYQETRKRHMDALGEISRQGFFSYLRNKRADYNAIYVTLELLAHRIFPKFVYPPLYLPIINDPAHSDDHLQRHLKRRKIGKLIGVAALVAMMTGVVAVIESVRNTSKKSFTS